MKKDNNSKKEVKPQENKNIHYRRITLELHKTDVFFIKTDVPLGKTSSDENTHAIKLAWTMIKNSPAADLEKFRAGDGFVQKILKRDEVDSDGNIVVPKRK